MFQEDFAIILNDLITFYNKKVTPQLIDAFYEALSFAKRDRLKQAIKNWIYREKMFPSIGELREYYNGTLNQADHVAIADCRKCDNSGAITLVARKDNCSFSFRCPENCGHTKNYKFLKTPQEANLNPKDWMTYNEYFEKLTSRNT